jgi:DNA-binding SARP family transcriptional activator
VVVRVLVPAVEVAVDGRPVAVSETQAKLLVALVAAHPAPLHVEQVSDLLWPDDAVLPVRFRLNSLVHRLRRALGGHGSAVVRAGDLLRLDGERCTADLWHLRRACGTAGPDRAAALAAVRGNVCAAQFPYDERLVDERHRVVGEWIGHARAAVRAGEIDTAALGPALAALGLAAADL